VSKVTLVHGNIKILILGALRNATLGPMWHTDRTPKCPQSHSHENRTTSDSRWPQLQTRLGLPSTKHQLS